eukprot:2808603-Rhodomonas_salina.1
MQLSIPQRHCTFPLTHTLGRELRGGGGAAARKRSLEQEYLREFSPATLALTNAWLDPEVEAAFGYALLNASRLTHPNASLLTPSNASHLTPRSVPVLYWRAGVLCYAVLSVLAGTCTTVPCGTACTGRNFDGVLQCYAVLFVLAGGRAASGGGWMTARRAANTCVRNQRQLHTRSVHFVPVPCRIRTTSAEYGELRQDMARSIAVKINLGA